MYSCRFNFSSFYNWMDAKTHHDCIKPIRTDGTRPIGNRRKKEANIREVGDTIVCRLYNTDVVTYHKSGPIEVFINGWVSQSTSAFISAALTPCGLRNNRMWVRAVTEDEGREQWLPLDPNGVNKFERTGSGDLKFLNPQPLTVHHINRARANNVRKQYKPFVTYLANMIKLRINHVQNVECSDQEYKDLFGVRTDFVGKTLVNYPDNVALPRMNWEPDMGAVKALLDEARSDTNEAHYRVFLRLVRSAGYPNFGSDPGGFWCHANNLIVHFDGLVLYRHRDECFDETDAKAGSYGKDRYSAFFRWSHD
jgi:hypothetical protein